MDKSPVKVLLVEDNPGDAKLFQLMLAEGGGHFQDEWVTRLSACVEKLELPHDFDVVLLDLSLPDSHGPETFLKVLPICPKTPVILLTGLNDQKLAVESMRQGVQDYLVKGQIDSNVLVRSIRYAIERKQSETLLLQNKLEEKIREAELQEQLRQSQKMDAIGKLVSGVAHDFNNLLMVIIGYSRILIDDETDPVRLEKMTIIDQTADRAAVLTRQLLAFSRQNASCPALLNINTIVADIEKMVIRLMGENIQLIFQPCAELAAVKADKGQIEQILMNLLVNARDAMPKGGTIKIETANQNLASDAFVLLSVKDSGTGMDKETQRKIFEPFFTTKELGKGTGLGLSTVHGIVDQNSGRIEVESELGQGTTFKIFLPIATDLPLEENNNLSETLAFLGGNERILLVEDDDSVRQVIAEILGRNGHKVFQASSGGEALKLWQEQSFDLLLSDVMMPEMSGFELVKEAKKLRSNTRALFISGHSADLHINEHADLEKNLIQKPFLPEKLLRAIRDVLDSQ